MNAKSTLENHYPAAPANVPATLTQPSASFKAQVRNVVLAILAFVLTYLVMVALAVLLAWACLKLGLMIMVLHFNVYLLLLGAGIMLMGGLVVFFMVKFLFASTGGTESPGIQIQESDEPALFEFIRRVADEVGTHFPRKIFLIPDANASVFYNSSFWSMFFPTKKNLNIGLGLVNSLNISEFKAVLAHEFGHFSQSSMSLGTYVYYVNQVIFNMLYRNDGWASAANSIAGIHQVMYFFVRLAAYIVQGVQWVLRGMYGIINRQYLSLSREMEFHADTIAASVSGSNNMAQALRQVELGAQTYHQTLEKCDELLKTKEAPLNAYIGQRVIAAHTATVNDLPSRHGVPVVTSDFMAQRPQNRVHFKDQWASHPTLAEREANLKAIGVEAPVLDESAWVVFQNPDKWQRELTDFLYRNIELEVSDVADEAFASILETEKAEQAFPKMYQGYYNGHILYCEKWSELGADTPAKKNSKQEIESLFSENIDNKIAALQQDIETLKAIGDERIDTKSFDFDGQKYQRFQASEVQGLLVRELEELQEKRQQQDIKIASTFYAHALSISQAKADTLKTAYQALQETVTLRNKIMEHALQIVPTVHHLALNDFFLPTALEQPFKELMQYHEPHLRELLQKETVRALLPAAMQENVKDVFSGSGLKYKHDLLPHRHNLEKLQSVTIEIGNFFERAVFEGQKRILMLQEEIAGF